MQHFYELVQAALSHKGLNYIVKGIDNCPPLLQGPAEIIYRILINLVGNSIKFTDKGTIIISLAIREPAQGDQTQLVMEITDTGIGIPKGKQDAIFEPFRRLTSSYRSRYPGTGLGLYAVKRMIDLVGGEISLVSKPNQGSTFICMIPVKTVDSSGNVFHDESFLFEKDETDTKEIMVLSEVTTASKRNELLPAEQLLEQQQEGAHYVLVVEDNLIAQHIASQYLIKQNCRVDTAESVAEATQLASKHDYQLILMDVGLPDGDGKDATQTIRSGKHPKNQDTPIIALTAHVDKNTKQDCLVAGMNEVYNKPLTPKKLKVILDTFLILEENQPTQNEESENQNNELAVINLDAAMELMQCDRENAKIMLDMFVASLPEEKAQLETAFHSRTTSRWEQVRKITHRLRGACGYCGVPQLHKSCEILETLLLDKTNPKDEEDSEIIQRYHDLINAIQAIQLAHKEL
ncbi:MAG: response regulator [Gammaproteobacteria bacterium]|nr:response regulator [Gammaproteobacteria bacterium]